jgi:hypothetical protein
MAGNPLLEEMLDQFHEEQAGEQTARKGNAEFMTWFETLSRQRKVPTIVLLALTGVVLAGSVYKFSIWDFEHLTPAEHLAAAQAYHDLGHTDAPLLALIVQGALVNWNAPAPVHHSIPNAAIS